MTITDVKKQIMTNTLNNFYIFTGEELEVQHRYIHKIAETKNQPVKIIDSVSESFFKGNSLFNISACYVCRDDSDFLKDTKCWDILDNLLGKNTLIFIVTKLDKRGVFYKHFSDSIVDFEKLDSRLLQKYIKRELALSDDECQQLIQVCDSSYGAILLEIDKIKQYSGINKTNHSISFFNLISKGIIYTPPTDSIFELTDSILAFKPVKAFRLLEDYMQIDGSALKLLQVLYNNAKRVLQVQSCDSKNVESSTGLNGWEISKIKPFCGIYRNRELVNTLRVIKETETGIKTGRIEESQAIPYVLVTIFSGCY